MNTELIIKEHSLTVPYLTEKRRIRVLLPDGYDLDGRTTYPVVYFHDGQNVFFDDESYSGVSWGIIPTIRENKDLPKMIVVAIDNDDEKRINEYTPWKISKNPLPAEHLTGGKGYEYASFIMDTVKPFIDKTYLTRTDADSTAMIGSSLGGTITSFMGIQYKQQIGRLGIFSLANWIHEAEFNDYLNNNTINPDQFIYIQVGAQEGDDTDAQFIDGSMKQTYINISIDYVRNLILKGYPIEQLSLNIYADDKHTESAWARNLPKAMRFLTQGW